jgi:probable rRNA maturation factor
LSILIQITNRQKTLPVDRRRIRRALRRIVAEAGIAEASISVAVVDDPTIAELHDRYMNDPDPTDVLSFVLERTTHALEGEVIVSADTAKTCAPRYRCSAETEMLRYLIHGALHLVGYDDATPKQRAFMRRLERRYLAADE